MKTQNNSMYGMSYAARAFVLCVCTTIFRKGNCVSFVAFKNWAHRLR